GGRIAPPSPGTPYPHAPRPDATLSLPGDFTLNRSAGMRRAYNYMLFAQISYCILACILKIFESSLTDVVDLVIMWLSGYEMSFLIPFRIKSVCGNFAAFSSENAVEIKKGG
ncbi:MAG: hypothetical protein PUK86_12935, partial [bacterium]|nr:hypothetical protein [bacterium]